MLDRCAAKRHEGQCLNDPEYDGFECCVLGEEDDEQT